MAQELYRQFASLGCPDHDIAETPIHPLQQPNILFYRLLADSLLVESKLLTLQNVTVNTARLTGAGSDNGVQTTGLELALEGTLGLAALSEAGSLLLDDGRGLLLLGGLGLLLASTTEGLAVVGLVPLTEGSGINLHNGGLGQGVCADQLVVGGVEGHSDDTGLAGDTLGAPGEVAAVETQSTELLVTTTGADKVNALGSDTGVGGLATLLEGSVERNVRILFSNCCDPPPTKQKKISELMGCIVPLLAVVGALGTSGTALVARIPRNTHICG